MLVTPVTNERKKRGGVASKALRPSQLRCVLGHDLCENFVSVLQGHFNRAPYVLFVLTLDMVEHRPLAGSIDPVQVHLPLDGVFNELVELPGHGELQDIPRMHVDLEALALQQVIVERPHLLECALGHVVAVLGQIDAGRVVELPLVHLRVFALRVWIPRARRPQPLPSGRNAERTK